MSLQDLLTKKEPEEPWQAVIAFSGDEGLSVAILWCSDGLRRDLRENGCSPEGCFLPDNGPGIFIWEGYLHTIEYPATPDHATEYDAEYTGTLRELTDAEWAALRVNKNPLDIPKPPPPVPKIPDCTCAVSLWLCVHLPGCPRGAAVGPMYATWDDVPDDVLTDERYIERHGHPPPRCPECSMRRYAYNHDEGPCPVIEMRNRWGSKQAAGA